MGRVLKIAVEHIVTHTRGTRWQIGLDASVTRPAVIGEVMVTWREITNCSCLSAITIIENNVERGGILGVAIPALVILLGQLGAWPCHGSYDLS